MKRAGAEGLSRPPGMPRANLAASGWRLIISLGGVHVAHSDFARHRRRRSTRSRPADIGAVPRGGSAFLDPVDVVVLRIDDDRAGASFVS